MQRKTSKIRKQLDGTEYITRKSEPSLYLD